MITEKDCMGLLLEVVPEFRELWNKHLQWWGNETAGLCNDMSEFSNYIYKNIENMTDYELVKIFNIIERLIIEGNADVSTAATTCFLENLQNMSYDNPKLLRFTKFLGPESRAYCVAWDEFMGVKTPGLY